MGNDKVNLAKVRDWFLVNAGEYGARKVQLEILGMTCGEWKDALSGRLSSPVFDGAVQLWDTGECDIQVLDIRSGDVVLNTTFEFADARHAIRAVEAVLDVLCRPVQEIEKTDFETAWSRTFLT